VDDNVLAACSIDLLRQTITALQHEFSMKDLRELHHFLGVAVQRHSGGLFLSQWQYTLDVLERTGMAECKPCTTPMDTQAKLLASKAGSIRDATQYRSHVGALQYLTFTRPDISYAVQQVCLHMHGP
jgi:hypothetical protein